MFLSGRAQRAYFRRSGGVNREPWKPLAADSERFKETSCNLLLDFSGDALSPGLQGIVVTGHVLQGKRLKHETDIHGFDGIALGIFAGEVAHAAVGNQDGVAAVAEFDAFNGVVDVGDGACLRLEGFYVDLPGKMAAVGENHSG